MATVTESPYNNHNLNNPNVKNNNILNNAELLFLRSSQMRGSRQSLRSSTDSSVHSTGSSGISCLSSEETVSPMVNNSINNAPTLTPTAAGVVTASEITARIVAGTATLAPNHNIVVSSSTEDESGFSSIGSFNDIAANTHLQQEQKQQQLKSANNFTIHQHMSMLTVSDVNNIQDADSTLKANVVGLPIVMENNGCSGAFPSSLSSASSASSSSSSSASLTANLAANPSTMITSPNGRWTMMPKKNYHHSVANPKLPRLSTLSNTENMNTVLWV